MDLEKKQSYGTAQHFQNGNFCNFFFWAPLFQSKYQHDSMDFVHKSSKYNIKMRAAINNTRNLQNKSNPPSNNRYSWTPRPPPYYAIVVVVVFFIFVVNAFQFTQIDLACHNLATRQNKCQPHKSLLVSKFLSLRDHKHFLSQAATQIRQIVGSANHSIFSSYALLQPRQRVDGWAVLRRRRHRYRHSHVDSHALKLLLR